MIDQHTTKSRLMAGLLAVQNPLAYADTADTTLARYRVNLAERAKAVTGLYLFQIEGLIHAKVRARERGIVDVPSMVHEAWLRWLQLHGRSAQFEVPMDGWLVNVFPYSLLTTDDRILHRLAKARKLGVSRPSPIPVFVPEEFQVPAQMFGEWAGVDELPESLALLAGFEVTPNSQSTAHMAVDHSAASELVAQLSEELFGIGAASEWR